MKKLIALLMILCMVTGLFAGCGKTEGEEADAPISSGNVSQEPGESLDETKEPKAPEDTKVMFAAPSLADAFQLTIEGLLRERFEEGGYQFESVSAELDAIKQIEQIENAAVQGFDLVIVWPVTGEAIADACQRAMDEGVLIFSFVNNSVNWNSHRTVDVEYSATMQAEMGSEWIDEHFGEDAPAGSVNCVVMSPSGDEHQATRLRILGEVIAQDPRVNLLESVDTLDDTADGQAKAENLLQKYPDTQIHLWLVGASAAATGVNAAIMAENSGVDYLEDCCLIANTLTDEFAEYLRMAENNESVIRALAATGGSVVNNVQGIYEQSQRMLNGEEYEPYFPVGVDKVYASNLADFGY